MDSDGQPPEAVFGAQVKRLRNELGIPLAALTGALCVSDGIELDPGALTLLEQGQRVIRLDEAVAFAKVLDMTVDEMLQPASSIDVRVGQARNAVARARSHVAEATAELDMAQGHLARLEALAAGGNGHHLSDG